MLQLNAHSSQQYTNMDSCRVQWCDLLHGGNVMFLKAKITPETLIFPKGL